VARNAPAAYGTDLGCILSTDSLFSSTTGIDVVRQDAYHRLLTDSVLGPAGDDWGYDCRRLLGAKDSMISAIQPLLTEVLLRDERIQGATVNVKASSTGTGLRIVTVTAQCQTAAGPFDLVLSIDNVSVSTIDQQTS
jgi:hypothetical protein